MLLLARSSRMGRSCSLAIQWGLLLLLPLGPASLKCPADQRKALQLIYEASGGHNWISRDLWNSNETCLQTLEQRNLSRNGQVVSLPPHCCWAGVDCCLLAEDIESFKPCAQYQCNCTVGSVTGISLGRNGLKGQLQDILSDEVISGLACSMRLIFLGGNGYELTGTVPPSLEAMRDLRILSLSSNSLTGTLPSQLANLWELEELDLSNNNLTGPVPPDLCGGEARVSKLRDLVLANNNLNGSLSLPVCDSLIYLDLQNNWLEGPLLDLSSYRQLHILRLGNNLFSGSVDTDSFDLRLLVVLDLSMNLLSGPLPNFVGNSSQMASLRLFNNSFSGPVPADLFTVGSLSQLQLQNNRLSGTLPENIGDARGISSLNLRANKLYGTLPESLSQLAAILGSVDLSLTQLSCCGYDFVEGRGYRYFNYSKPRLPSFLMKSSLSRPPVDSGVDLSNMRCPLIMVDPRFTPDNTVLTWGLDPEYNLYDGCTCVDGYRQVWSSPAAGVPSMGPVLSCVKESDPWYIQFPWAVVLIVLGGLLVAAWLTYAMCFRRGKNAAVVRGVLGLRKRLQGEPAGGHVSVVVTDIEGYSELMKQSPELMTRALNTHNAIIRKARWTNFGYTLEQEGDSFALVFYEAHDAVVFCLQTQLALNRQTWPEGLFAADKESMVKRRQQAPSLVNAISMMTNNLLALSLFGGRASTAGPEDRSTALMGGGGSSALAPHAANPSLDCRPDLRQASTVAAVGWGPPNASAAGPGPSLLGDSSPVAGLAGLSATTQAHHHKDSSRERGAPHASAHAHALFNGLRVRMGIATGPLPPGSNSKGSAVMDVAKLVSDAANGGQVMMDESTFKCIKERIEEFGAVDHHGMNFKKLNAIKSPWYTCARRKHLHNRDDAIILDMGEYTHCPGCKRLPLFQLEATPLSGADTPGAVAGEPGAALLTPATPRGKGRGGGKGYDAPVRLYQIVPPQLVGRAKVFGNKVTMKDEWYGSDAPYFDAPGTLDAPLGPVEGPLALPYITMAFAIVEGGKGFAARHRRDVRRLNDVIAACIRACLRVVAAAVAPSGPGGGGGAGSRGGGGGYLCRLQDGDLKYMVAFGCPEAAVEWSLLLQDVLLHADWPESALKYWREEYDDRGQLVFRGPRMKIGVCEGPPRSIIPDHIGRADYHGASINQAARYMDAAAHGGMIAIEASLVAKVMNRWREAAAQTAEAAAAASSVASATASDVTSTTPSASAFAVPCTSAIAIALGSGSGASLTTSDSSRVGQLSSVAAAAAAPSSSAVATLPPLRVASRKSRMAAVQEVDAADVAGEPPPPAAAGPAKCGMAPAPFAAALPGQAAGAVNIRTGGAGPVAEAAEGDGDGDVAATAKGDGKAGSDAAAATAALPEVVYGKKHVDRRTTVESGPSMTSLTSSSHIPAVLGTCSSTLGPPPAHLFASSLGNATSTPTAAVPPAAAGNANFGLGSGEITEGSPVAAATTAAANAAHVSAPGAQQQQQRPTSLQPVGSASIPPLPLPRHVAGASGGGGGLSSTHSASRSPGAGARAPVSCAAPHLAAHPLSACNSGVRPLAEPAAAMLAPPPSFSTTAGGGSDGVGDATAAAAELCSAGPSATATRTPSRPPSLPPLSLPSERERDEALRLERAAAEAARAVSVDGPADASYTAHVLAFRMGVFCFKGNPEPIPMAHVVLEHLASRTFPPDAPKGKGAKVADSSGLLDECDIALPNLASLMRDRFMRLNGPLAAAAAAGHQGGGGGGLLPHSTTMDVPRSSPNSRLRALLGGGTSPKQALQLRGGGDNDIRTMRKSRSMAARIASGGAAAGGAGGASSDSGVAPPLPPPLSGGGGGGLSRRGLMSQFAHFAAASMRWAAAGGKSAACAAAAEGQRGAGGRELLELPSPSPSPQAGAEGTWQRSSAGSGSGGTAAAASAAAGVAAAAGTRSQVVVALECEVREQGQQRESGAANMAAGSSGGGSDPRVVASRPSPLRFMSGPDDPPSDRQPSAVAAAASGSAGAARSDEHV